MSHIKIFSDGGYRQCHGVGAYSFIIAVDGDVVKFGSRVIENSTSNRCEYLGVLTGIEAVGGLGIVTDDCNVEIVSDSKLVINQIAGGWKINDPELLKLNAKVMVAGKKVFGNAMVVFTWNKRSSEYTARCDKMCDDAIEKFIASRHSAVL